ARAARPRCNEWVEAPTQVAALADAWAGRRQGELLLVQTEDDETEPTLARVRQQLALPAGGPGTAAEPSPGTATLAPPHRGTPAGGPVRPART
ncbi:MAG: hypothetical protein ACKOJF_15580, partial [Planctomycetaceae bacterium]